MKRPKILPLILAAMIIMSTPVFGLAYEYAIGRRIGSGFWGPAHGEYIEGFILSIIFFMTFAPIIFYPERRSKIIALTLGSIFVFDIFLGAWENMIVNLIFLLFCLSIAGIGLFLKAKFLS